MLYLVPTPVGHLGDMTFRGVEILQQVELILAEDTRTSSTLLKHYQIDTPLKPFHSHNEHKILASLIEKLKAGSDLACITDAGTPGISDPGFLLVRACKQNDIEVSCLPGATAFVPALVCSGIPCDRFYFEGFLPHKKGRQTRWLFLKELNTTVVIYESTHRIIKCIGEIIEYFGPQTVVCISKEISKRFETHYTATAEECLAFITQPGKSKGEFVLTIQASAD